MQTNHPVILVVALSLATVWTGCGKGPKTAGQTSQTVIASGGSDTMVNLAQMWAEDYRRVAPTVSVEVSGGGSGVGIRDLSRGMVQIANSSRDIEAMEREQTRKNTGKDPFETTVGYDAIAVYVHKDNPLNELTFQQLTQIFGENGTVDRWSQIGVDPARVGGHDEIIRVSRQNSSGTYFYFRDHVMKKKDFKLGSRDMSGSKEVVELVARARSAIGYSGMGYATPGVKMLSLRINETSPPVPPSVETVTARRYPLARPLLMYTLGPPEGATKAYMDWIVSSEGQKVVEIAGFVPIPYAVKQP